MLLFLVTHSILVTITHHHDRDQSVSRIETCSVEASRGGDSGKLPVTNSDTCCLSCCLQHNLIVSIRPVSTISSDQCPKPVSAKMLVSKPTSNGVSLLLPNRAPPLG